MLKNFWGNIKLQKVSSFEAGVLDREIKNRNSEPREVLEDKQPKALEDKPIYTHLKKCGSRSSERQCQILDTLHLFKF
ncbi:MAG: hypothetical protein EA369_06195 [Bradymonadales bacterium]|nr:MAG: hypothetical protein EA369_06195 [Bradymonadales bacterium]